jgi:hypothetical protein
MTRLYLYRYHICAVHDFSAFGLAVGICDVLIYGSRMKKNILAKRRNLLSTEQLFRIPLLNSETKYRLSKSSGQQHVNYNHIFPFMLIVTRLQH